MKGIDMVTQLINTGAKQNVSGKQGGSSSDQKDFEKMLEQAGQRQGFTAGETTDNSAAPAATVETVSAAAASPVEEPGTEELSIAAALVTVQPMIPVEPFTPVEVEEPVPPAAEGVTLETDAFAQQQTATTLDIDTQQQSQEGDNAFGQAAEALTAKPEQEQAAENVETAAPEEEDAAPTTEHVEAKRPEATEEEAEDIEPEVEDASAAAEAPVFEHTATVPVKVAETGEPVEAEADDAAEQIARHIEQAVSQGESRVAITLSPENLGQLTVEITRSGDGTLSIVLTTVSEKAAHLIDRHAVSLQQMLADNTQNVHVEIETRTQETQAQQFLNPDGRNNHHREGQQQQKRKEENHNDGDFLQQLRLGLVGMD